MNSTQKFLPEQSQPLTVDNTFSFYYLHLTDHHPGVRSRGVDTGPRASVAGLGHQRIRPGGSGRRALPSAGRQGPVQVDQRGDDAPHVRLQR